MTKKELLLQLSEFPDDTMIVTEGHDDDTEFDDPIVRIVEIKAYAHPDSWAGVHGSIDRANPPYQKVVCIGRRDY